MADWRAPGARRLAAGASTVYRPAMARLEPPSWRQCHVTCSAPKWKSPRAISLSEAFMPRSASGAPSASAAAMRSTSASSWPAGARQSRWPSASSSVAGTASACRNRRLAVASPGARHSAAGRWGCSAGPAGPPACAGSCRQRRRGRRRPAPDRWRRRRCCRSGGRSSAAPGPPVRPLSARTLRPGAGSGRAVELADVQARAQARPLPGDHQQPGRWVGRERGQVLLRAQVLHMQTTVLGRAVQCDQGTARMPVQQRRAGGRVGAHGGAVCRCATRCAGARLGAPAPGG